MLIGVAPAIRKIAGQRDDHGRAADGERHRRRDDRAEDEQQRERRERQRDELAPPQVGLGHLLDVAVERRPAGQPDLQPGGVVNRRADARQRPRGVVRGQVEQDDVVRGVPVGGDLPRRQGVRDHALDELGARARPRAPSRRAISNAGSPAFAVSEWRTMTSAASGTPISVSRSALACADSRSSRMNPPDAERAGRLQRERHGRENQHAPGDDDGPAVPRRPPPESLESAQRRCPRRSARGIGAGSVGIGSTMLAVW